MQDSSAISLSVSSLPEKVTQLYNKPKELFGKGNVDLLKRTPTVGIVGARKFTPYGREVTEDIARAMAKAGVVVISGLALGVDSVAHRACMEAGGATIAVLPCGIDTIYPSSHSGLARQIIDHNGLLISEYAGRSSPRKHQFIERNRIIASLSDVLIVTEAAENSGSLHTARFALELGKTIMAVPGQITSAYSKGTNRLIQTGAVPLLSSSDVLNELGIAPQSEIDYLPEHPQEVTILQLLKTPKSSDELLRSSAISLVELQTHLTMLEIKGVIQISSGMWRKK